MRSNLFSVLIATYSKDDPLLFAKAFSSIIDNSVLPYEIVLVVDGPIPLTLENKIEEIKNIHPTKILRLNENKGLAFALNAGIELITTEWVVRCDSDDINHSNRFETLIEYMNENYDLIGSVIKEYQKDGRFVAEKSVPITENDIREYIKNRNPFNHMSVAYRRRFVISCGGYPELYQREDYGLWIMMLSKGAKAINIPSPLVDVTAGEDMYKRRGGFRYAMGEFELQRLLVQCGFKGLVHAIFSGAARIVIFISPVPIRAFIYKKYLRSDLNK